MPVFRQEPPPYVEKQIKPVDSVHATFPQTQVTELVDDPSVVAQAAMGAVPHTFNKLSQNRPDATEQKTPDAPHKQDAAFDVAPLVCAQLGAATHRQNSE